MINITKLKQKKDWSKIDANNVGSSTLLDCPTCKGEGTLRRYPYYATQMPDMIDVGCETCRGKGKIIVIDSPYEICRKGAI
jgi:DnaJ-class molecular chaperone